MIGMNADWFATKSLKPSIFQADFDFLVSGTIPCAFSTNIWGGDLWVDPSEDIPLSEVLVMSGTFL